ncbi:Secreted RxLR effector protein [Sesamum angolense]|uniref:Secreted RxLR effector protein n=1 Tax=Sesamum angolense TaxID=2727404 RepID=A0AAE1WQ96_9LAMI|nr:Secreted RxLR effector protein [Sesamum angolense]
MVYFLHDDMALGDVTYDQISAPVLQADVNGVAGMNERVSNAITSQQVRAMRVAFRWHGMMSKHWAGDEVAKRILRYIKNTLSYGLMYKQSKSFSLSGFVDADWARDVNDRRSAMGFCFKTEKVLSQVELQKIRTDEQVADKFTQTLARAKFDEFHEALGDISPQKISFALKGASSSENKPCPQADILHGISLALR